MQVQVRLVGEPSALSELFSLRDWLVREREFRGRVDIVGPEPKPGDMGQLADVLMVTLASGGAVSVLARSVSVWLEQRRSTLTVEIIDGDGGSMKVTAGGPAADIVAKNFDPDRRADRHPDRP